jgi:hypothetical protein
MHYFIKDDTEHYILEAVVSSVGGLAGGRVYEYLWGAEAS